MIDYFILQSFDIECPDGAWQICKGKHLDYEVVWSRPCDASDYAGQHDYPADVRSEYERLLGRTEFLPNPDSLDADSINLVEIIADDDECAFDQPCRYGNRVDGHAVYCHNDGWLYAPRKCRRTWYTGGEVRDEDCPGYAPNLRSGHHR